MLTLKHGRRKRAAPHIKTYIRFSDASMQQIDWAMVTSANLSTQAWGSAASATGEVRICSYEIGVVVWPALWDDADDDDMKAIMVPVFGCDTPSASGEDKDDEQASTRPQALVSGRSSLNADEAGKGVENRRKGIVVGWRMPYDLPLVPYGKDEMPWCTTEPCSEPDWMGRIWSGYGR